MPQSAQDRTRENVDRWRSRIIRHKKEILPPIFRSLRLINNGKDMSSALVPRHYPGNDVNSPQYSLKYHFDDIVKDVINIRDYHDIAESENMFIALEMFIREFYFFYMIFIDLEENNEEMNEIVTIDGSEYNIRNQSDVERLITVIHTALQKNKQKYLETYRTQVIPNKQTK